MKRKPVNGTESSLDKPLIWHSSPYACGVASRCSLIFPGIDAKVTSAHLQLGTCLDTILCFTITPYALSDTD